ncbi:MAG: hypothetical protein GY913_19440 [Proteobacteria bacterium]|nr:hypothetical protein [Pseudomonadota bacterium]MCP4919085.1 hypothetical protein [Pseudomonadota bacterium]
MDVRTTLGELWPHFSAADLDGIWSIFEGLELVELADNHTLFSAGDENCGAWLILVGSIG